MPPELKAVTCKVIAHAAPTDADKALLAADYDRAATLYQAQIAAAKGNPDLTAVSTAGLVHALLRAQKLTSAAEAVKTSLALDPDSPALLTLRGEVELRQGLPWIAAATVEQSFKLDPCNPRTRLLFSHVARLSSLYATSYDQLMTAHRIDPEDPEIRSAWINTLPRRQRILELEAYLAAPTGEDADSMRRRRTYLDHLRRQSADPHPPCRLVSTQPTTEIPFTQLMRDATHIRAFGLDVKLNDKAAKMQIDTGAGGLLISRAVADRAGLKPFTQTEMNGIGDQGQRSGYTALVDSIRIGNLEFQNCSVEVLDSRNALSETDGLIGMDVFQQFLVTLDYPMRKLVLGPLPPRPGQAAPPAPALKTNTSETEESASADAARPDAARPDATTPESTRSDTVTSAPPQPAPDSPKPRPNHGPWDRYIAPEMKDYSAVYRVGHQLMLPAALNKKSLKLFIMDTGSWSTTISPDAAREVTKVHTNDNMHIRGINGKVENVYEADDVTFTFAHISQRVFEVPSFDTLNISRNIGMDISGFIGASTLKLLTIHIDYRDGLVKFDYDANRGYQQ